MNAPQALAVAHELSKDKTLVATEPKGVLALLYRFDEVFGLRLAEYVRQYQMTVLLRDKKLKKFIDDRMKFRDRQQFIQADRLRKKIDGLGYLMEDTPAGTFVAPKVVKLL